jgi:hypothetical protein
MTRTATPSRVTPVTSPTQLCPASSKSATAFADGDPSDARVLGLVAGERDDVPDRGRPVDREARQVCAHAGFR